MSQEEHIRTALNRLDEQTAKDALALLLAEKHSGVKSDENSWTAEGNDGLENTAFANFSQAISWLKSKYRFQELAAFSTEADLVYVTAGDRKILLTDTRVQIKPLSGAGGDLHTDDFENAWENSVSNKREPQAATHGRASDTAAAHNTLDDLEQAFEPLPKNSRFSHLEL